jgi:hypothetical protein
MTSTYTCTRGRGIPALGGEGYMNQGQVYTHERGRGESTRTSGEGYLHQGARATRTKGKSTSIGGATLPASGGEFYLHWERVYLHWWRVLPALGRVYLHWGRVLPALGASPALPQPRMGL